MNHYLREIDKSIQVVTKKGKYITEFCDEEFKEVTKLINYQENRPIESIRFVGLKNIVDRKGKRGEVFYVSYNKLNYEKEHLIFWKTNPLRLTYDKRNSHNYIQSLHFNSYVDTELLLLLSLFKKYSTIQFKSGDLFKFNRVEIRFKK